jgi:hypothetical protein
VHLTCRKKRTKSGGNKTAQLLYLDSESVRCGSKIKCEIRKVDPRNDKGIFVKYFFNDKALIRKRICYLQLY